VETDVFGVMQEIELVPNGANIAVTQVGRFCDCDDRVLDSNFDNKLLSEKLSRRTKQNTCNW